MNSGILKGTLTVIILKLLSERDRMYGYQIIQKIRESSEGRIILTEGALYPALHKLENSGLLEVEYEMVKNRSRKYYRLSAKGKKAGNEQFSDLMKMMQDIQLILNPGIKII